MKLHAFILIVLVVLFQIIFSQATLTQSSSEDNNLKRMSSAWGKRMSSAWGKRMSSAWGKRDEDDSDEHYNNVLRQLFRQTRLNKYNYPRYPFDNEAREQYYAQRISSDNDGDVAPRHMS